MVWTTVPWMECGPFQGNNAVTEKPSTQWYLVHLLGTPCYKYQVEHQQLWVTQFVNTNLSLILHVLYFNFYLFIFILFLYSSCFLFPFQAKSIGSCLSPLIWCHQRCWKKSYCCLETRFNCRGSHCKYNDKVSLYIKSFYLTFL